MTSAFRLLSTDSKQRQRQFWLTDITDLTDKTKKRGNFHNRHGTIKYILKSVEKPCKSVSYFFNYLTNCNSSNSPYSPETAVNSL